MKPCVILFPPGGVTILRRPLADFVTHQEHVLRVHDPKKGGMRVWRQMPPAVLLRYLEDEVRELRLAIESGAPELMQHEAVDVANFCMMLHDVAAQVAMKKEADDDSSERQE